MVVAFGGVNVYEEVGEGCYGWKGKWRVIITGGRWSIHFEKAGNVVVRSGGWLI